MPEILWMQLSYPYTRTGHGSPDPYGWMDAPSSESPLHRITLLLEDLPMSQVPVWFERSFVFSFPVEVFPNLCARLLGTPARLEEMVRFIPEELLTRKVDGTWSAQENAGHLADMEPLWLARVQDYVAGNAELTVADLTNRKTTEAGHNTRPLAEILLEFRAAREQMLHRLSSVDASLWSRPIPHPRLRTPMRLVDHLYFVAEHDDHHLARIRELTRNA